MTMKKKSVKSLRENQEHLPVHPSDAGVEIPDSAEKRGARAVKPELDGQKIAAKAEGIQIPEEEEKEMQEDADKDLPIHPSHAGVQIPDKLKEEDEDEMKLGEEEKDEDEKEDEMKLGEEDEKEDEKKLGEEDEKEDEMKLGEEDEKEDEKEDEMKLSEEEEKELEEQDDEEIKKHVEALTADEELPEAFKNKAAAVFEAAVKHSVKRRTNVIRGKLSELYKAKLTKKTTKISESLVDKVDGYLDYVVEEWMKENEVAIETGLKSEIVENFIHGLKGLFESHYIEVPATKTDILSEQTAKISDLEKELNETLNKNVELKKRLISLEKQSVIKKASEGLTVSEAAKFTELCEGVSFESAKAFAQKLAVVKETYFPKAPKRSGDLDNELLTEGGLQQPKTSSKDEIDLVVDTISRMVKK